MSNTKVHCYDGPTTAHPPVPKIKIITAHNPHEWFYDGYCAGPCKRPIQYSEHINKEYAYCYDCCPVDDLGRRKQNAVL